MEVEKTQSFLPKDNETQQLIIIENLSPAVL
jgi:hypothetical protein